MAGKDYKCPCCGGTIGFDTKAQKLKCPYCDTEFEMSTLDEYGEAMASDGQDKMEWEIEAQKWEPGETEGMRVYTCKSCGGQIVGDENMSASTCPYCDSPIVLEGQFQGALKPEYVIPFKLQKKDARAKFFEHLKGKTLLPAVFKSQSNLDDIKGIYVPYWIYDSTADARIHYRCIKERRYSDNEYDYTEKKYYSVLRAGDIAFEHVPVGGCTKIDEAILESVEPFDFSGATEFRTDYLAGFMADKYDKQSDECVERANTRVKNSTEEEFKKTVKGYNSVERESGSVQLRDGKSAYALYPVWLMSTSWQNEKYMLAMNGQTGKFVGKLPLDKTLANIWLFGLTLVLTAIFSIISAISGNFSGKGVVIALVISFIISLIVNLVMKSNLNSISLKSAARDYVVKDSMHVKESKEMYLYTKVDKVKKATTNDNNK